MHLTAFCFRISLHLCFWTSVDVDFSFVDFHVRCGNVVLPVCQRAVPPSFEKKKTINQSVDNSKCFSANMFSQPGATDEGGNEASSE